MTHDGQAKSTSAPAAAPLDELMLAMDVVDTLRHEQRLVARELALGDRDGRLIERLREIYAGQGIDVPDDVLVQGVRALREQRFAYAGPRPGLRRSLEVAYVTRGRWARYFFAGVVAAAMVAVAAIALV